MNIRIVAFVLALVVYQVWGKTSSGYCTRPDGTNGLCVRYNQCPEILEQITRPQKNYQELVKYRCGFDGSVAKVCCNYDCYTPEGNLGKCKHLNTCPHLLEMANGTDKKATLYVRNSRCLTGPRDVCCGPPPAPKYFEETDDCPSQLSAFPPNPSSLCCGNDAKADSRIVGGENTGIDQFPWLALLEYKRQDSGAIRTYCGGALISNRYVLTASHCINGPGAWPPVNVRLGEYDTRTAEDCVDGECADAVNTIAIEEIITHPKYERSTSRNDIALLRLASPVNFTDFIRPICLPMSNVLLKANIGGDAYAAGWGKVNDTHFRSSIKQHVKLPILSTKDCQKAFNDRMSIPPKLTAFQMCAGGEEGKDSCNGDSGGPLMLKTGLLHELVGIVSYGSDKCGTKGLPGIYTNVHAYSTWIRRNIRP